MTRLAQPFTYLESKNDRFGIAVMISVILYLGLVTAPAGEELLSGSARVADGDTIEINAQRIRFDWEGLSHRVSSPVPSSFSRRRGADAPGTICQQLMKLTAPGTICHRHGDQPLMGTRAWWRHLPRCRALDRGTRPLRRAFLTSQPKWQGDLPELARPGTLFLGKRPQARDIGPCSGLIAS
jgi:hypothetical protein